MIPVPTTKYCSNLVRVKEGRSVAQTGWTFQGKTKLGVGHSLGKQEDVMVLVAEELGSFNSKASSRWFGFGDGWIQMDSAAHSRLQH